ncbi:MAG: tetratricopeptide (TPR) repeat protein [Rhodothermales bacterium]|jgi:tetratricopeptide (TPR) repeat protein
MQKRAILTTLGLVSLVFAIYANSLQHAFTNWDDDRLVLNNPDVQRISLVIWTPRAGASYQPIRVFSYALNYQLHGTQPFGYHVMNTVLHAVAVIFLWLFMRVALPALGVREPERAALFVALLFAVHPINVESVTWITSRKYGLLASFSFLSLWLYARDKPVPAAIAALAATLSSPFGVTIPALILLFDFCRRCELRKRWKQQAPFAICLLAVLPLLAGIFSAGGRDAVVKSGLNPLWAFFSMLRCVFDYARNLLLPLWLNNRYPDHVSTNPFSLKILLAVAGLIAVSIFVWRRYTADDRVPLFCAGWVLLTWFPVSGLVPISTMMADRYLYLPGVGIFLAAVICLRRPALLSVVVAIFAIGSVARNTVWRDSLSLWSDSVAKDPRNYAAHVSLALALEDTGKDSEAADHYADALALQPDFFLAHYNLGLLRLKLGQLTLAEQHLTHATKLEPQHSQARLNLGLCQMAAERSGAAIATFRALLAQDEHNADAHNALASKLSNTDPAAALQHFSRALELRPQDPRLRCNLAGAQRDAGELKTALTTLASIPPSFIQAHRYRAEICELRNDAPGAIAHWQQYQRAVSDPVDRHRASVQLGALQHEAGDLPAAIRSYSEATRLNAHDRESRAALVRLHLESGDLKRAQGFAIQASLRNPRFPRDLRLILTEHPDFANALRTQLADSELTPIHHLLGGQAAAALGDQPTAKAHFSQAASDAPAFFPAHLALGELLIEMGAPEAARAALKTAQSLAPDLPEIQAALKLAD